MQYLNGCHTQFCIRASRLPLRLFLEEVALPAPSRLFWEGSGVVQEADQRQLSLVEVAVFVEQPYEADLIESEPFALIRIAGDQEQCTVTGNARLSSIEVYYRVMDS